MDASEGQVFIAVYHNENHTNLYLSDEEGVYYSLTLEDVVTNEEDDWISGNAVVDVHVVCIYTSDRLVCSNCVFLRLFHFPVVT